MGNAGRARRSGIGDRAPPDTLLRYIVDEQTIAGVTHRALVNVSCMAILLTIARDQLPNAPAETKDAFQQLITSSAGDFGFADKEVKSGLNEAAVAALELLQEWECHRHPPRWPARLERIDRWSRINDDGEQQDLDTSKRRSRGDFPQFSHTGFAPVVRRSLSGF
jgi:hypothetical protein